MTDAPVSRIRSRVARARRTERGAAAAEYAVATAAGCGFAGVLITLLTSDFGKRLLELLFELVKSVLPAL